MNSKYRGFSLIELMITVAIFAIVSSLAVGNYRSYMMRTHRTEATAALLQIQVAQEKFYLQNNTYATNAQLSLAPPNGLGLSTTTSPGGNYTVAISNTNATADYLAVAVAVATKGQNSDTACRKFFVNQSGTKTAMDSDGADTSAKCWR